jgi:hypothetical protein
LAFTPALDIVPSATLRLRKMAHQIGRIGAIAVLWLSAGAPAAFADVSRSHCGVISHDVANLNAIDPRRAYWCKSDVAGYLGEARGPRIEPYHGHWHHRRIIVTDR